MKVGKKIMLVGAIPLALMVLVGIASALGIFTLNDTNKWVDHTHNVIQDAMKVEAAAVDMETGMRGYLLSGKEDFLEPYNGGRERFNDEIVALQNTVSDNQPQVALLKDTQKIINDWQKDVTEPMINLRREIGDAKTMDDMADEVSKEKGKIYFDKFRKQIAGFIEAEYKLIVVRQKSVQDKSQENAKNSKIIRDTKKWVEHTHNVIEAAMTVEAAAVDMETGMRGFLLAGKEEFLEPYNNGSERFNLLVDSLKNTVSDNPAQVKLLSEIKSNIHAWKSNITEKGIALRRNSATKLEDISSMVAEGKGKQYFDKFRDQIATFVNRERELLISRKKASLEALDMSIENREAIADATKWVEHTHNVIQTAMKIEAAAVDMETGMRGYLLAGKEQFLEPYNNGTKIFFDLVGSLSNTVSDNPAQVKLLSEIKNTINEWKSNVTEVNITLRRDIGDASTKNDMARLVG